jgi:isochorismate pyruvate lyase
MSHRSPPLLAQFAAGRVTAGHATLRGLQLCIAARYMMRMTDKILPPDDCTTMADVRSGVDTIDEAICRLIETRFAYMDAAARIKPSRSDVRDEVRKAEVKRNVQRHARAAGWSPDLAASLWEALIEASIDFELQRFDRQRDKKKSATA